MRLRSVRPLTSNGWRMGSAFIDDSEARMEILDQLDHRHGVRRVHRQGTAIQQCGGETCVERVVLPAFGRYRLQAAIDTLHAPGRLRLDAEALLGRYGAALQLRLLRVESPLGVRRGGSEQVEAGPALRGHAVHPQLRAHAGLMEQRDERV